MKKRVIYYLIDGARPDILQKLSHQGLLPNMTKYLIEEGSFITSTSCLPSTTGPAYLPMLTGHFPGDHHITGIRWFDKKNYFQTSRWNRGSMRSYCGYEAKYFNDDMDPSMPSLFETYDHGFNIYNMITKGVEEVNDLTKDIKTKLYFKAHFYHKHHQVDKAGHQCLMKCLNGDPRFIFAVFPSIDWDAHTYHYEDEKTIDAYRIADSSLGEVVEKLKRQNRYDETLIIMSSDHGLSATTNHLDLGKYFKNKGFRVLEYPNIFTIRPNLAISISGNAFASLSFLDSKDHYFAEDLDRNHGKVLNEFVQEPAIDFIIYRKDSDSIAVQSESGRSHIRMKNGRYWYTIDTADPLDIGTNIKNADASAIFDQTYHTQYPDSIFQICQLMQSDRAGDVLVCAANGHDLRDFWEIPEHKGSHGSLHKDHMLMPVLTNKKHILSKPGRSNEIHGAIKQWLDS